MQILVVRYIKSDPGSNMLTVNVRSIKGNKNRIESMTFSAVIVSLASFNSKLSYYLYVSNTNVANNFTILQNFGTPSSYGSLNSPKYCLNGIVRFQKLMKDRPAEGRYVLNGTNIVRLEVFKLENVRYNTLCLF